MDIKSNAVNLVCLLELTNIKTGFPLENFRTALYKGLFMEAILGQ